MAIAEALRQSGKGVFQIIPSSTLGEGRGIQRTLEPRR